MTIVSAPPRRTVPPAPPGRRRRALPLLLLAGWFAQVCVRLWFSRARTGPAADPDETGYLAAARWLAGGPGADLSANTFYQGGYPLLLAPAYWVSHDPAVVYTLVMVINAVLGAALFPLGYLAARRFGLARRAALALAWAAALLPAVTFFGSFALADTVLPLTVLGWLLALDRFVRRGRTSDAIVASLAITYAVSVHSRGEVLLAVHAVTLAALAAASPCARLLRRVRPFAAGLPRAGACLAGVAVAVAGYAAASAFNDRLRGALYPDGTRDLAGTLGERLTSLDGQAWALSGAAGQVWYLAASTWGLAGAGLVAVAAAVLRRRSPAATRIMAGVLLAAAFGVAYASSGALPDEHRVGNFAYGRYLACFAVVFALAGAATLIRAGTRTAVRYGAAGAAVLAVTGLWVRAYAGERLRTHAFIGFDFPEVMFLTGDRTALRLATASLAAAGLLCAFVALGRLRRGAPAGLALVLAGVDLAALTFVIGPGAGAGGPRLAPGGHAGQGRGGRGPLAALAGPRPAGASGVVDAGRPHRRADPAARGRRVHGGGEPARRNGPRGDLAGAPRGVAGADRRGRAGPLGRLVRPVLRVRDGQKRVTRAIRSWSTRKPSETKVTSPPYSSVVSMTWSTTSSMTSAPLSAPGLPSTGTSSPSVCTAGA